MSDALKPPEAVSRAGMDFSYAQWSPGSSVILTRVKWDSAYRNIVTFEDNDAILEHMNSNSSEPFTIRAMTYLKPNEPIRVDIPFNTANKYNYLVAHNPPQPSQPKDEAAYFYYFINEIRYVNPHTTELILQLDVWTTFQHRIKFGQCYIERGHIGIADSNQMSRNGRDALTIPEGLDVGGEYAMSAALRTAIGVPNRVSIIVTSTVDLEADPGDITKPNMVTATGGVVQNLPQGANIYHVDSVNSLSNMLSTLSASPWVAQHIISMTLMPGLESVTGAKTKFGGVTKINSYKSTFVDDTTFDHKAVGTSLLPDRYKHLNKFLTSPYCHIELNVFNGQPLILKPELMPANERTLKLSFAYCALPPAPRVMFFVNGYNSTSTAPTTTSATGVSGEWLAHSSGITNLPQLSTVNNSYLTYMASNANQRAFSYQSADWSNQRTVAGAQLSYDQASAGIQASNDQTALANSQASKQFKINRDTADKRMVQSMGNSMFNAGNAIASGNTFGGIVSGVQGVLNSYIDNTITASQDAATTNLAIHGNSTSNAINVGNASYVRDSNYDYARFAAKGDYQNQIASINAKIQDARLLSPTTSGQMGGDAMMYSLFNGFYVLIRLMMVAGASQRAIGEFWLRYGYAINTFRIIDTLHVMSNFTYWKLKETNLDATAMPEVFKNAIRGVFEKGVTVWKDPELIGMIDVADNKPLTGIKL